MAGPGLLGGRYELRDVLGFGGMAEVRDGWDTRLNRAVAIKLLHPGLSSQADIRERFTIEARAAAALNHPNIVGIYDFGEQDGIPFIVMERLPGDTLGDQIALGPLPEAQVSAALRSVLAALAAAHGAGMLHRDIKPGNILLAPPGSVKVADFGIVKTPGSAHTTTGQIVGTLAYLSPDRIEGKPASVGDDLYAAGVVGYEALTGCKPFLHEEIVPLARAILEDDPTPLTALRPDVDPCLADVIRRAMSRDPQARFGSADEMWEALTGHPARRVNLISPMPVSVPGRPPTAVLNARPASYPSTVTTPPGASRHRRSRARQKGKVAGAAALLSAMAVAVVAFALDPTSPRPTTAEPVSISAEVPAPTSVTAAVPPPVVEPPPTAAQMVEQATVVEQAIQPPIRQDIRGSGNGNGNGNGNGKKNGTGRGNGKR
ncbi:MAG TPA: serine/threonine-protein kinase [Mycobacterium sp.]